MSTLIYTVPVLFIRDKTFFSRAIRLATLGKWHHCAILDVHSDTFIEARPFKGVVGTPLDERMADLRAKGSQFEIVEFPSIVPAQMVCAAARRELGKSYDWQGLIGRRRPDYWYCSELIAHALDMLPHIDTVPIISPQELYVLGKRLEQAFSMPKLTVRA